jgi:hypothetical protein
LRLLTSLGLVARLANDDILRLLGFAREVVLNDGLGASSITSLSIECRSRVVGYHAVTTIKRVLHRPPSVVLGCRLNVPHVTGVAVKLTTLDGLGDSVLVADRTTGGVNEPSALLEVFEQLGVDETACAFVQGAVDSDDITLGNKLLQVLNAAGIDGLCSSLGQGCVVVINELLGVEGLETLQDTVSNTAGTNGTNDLALKIEGVASYAE